MGEDNVGVSVIDISSRLSLAVGLAGAGEGTFGFLIKFSPAESKVVGRSFVVVTAVSDREGLVAEPVTGFAAGLSVVVVMFVAPNCEITSIFHRFAFAFFFSFPFLVFFLSVRFSEGP